MLLRYSCDKRKMTEESQSKISLLISNVTAAFVPYLMFLSAFALLLNLLLFFQFLSDARLSQRLTLAAFVGLGIKGSL